MYVWERGAGFEQYVLAFPMGQSAEEADRQASSWSEVATQARAVLAVHHIERRRVDPIRYHSNLVTPSPRCDERITGGVGVH
jgi:hypothetical protein